MKRIDSFILAGIVLALGGVNAGPAVSAVRIVASTTDLASIAESVGGDLVEVTAIAGGTTDPHYVEVLPSHMIKVKKAQVYLRVGMDLDRWAGAIIDGSRNASLVVVDCSRAISPLNVPTGKVDASQGDLHPRGNPHYWLDPDNGMLVATTIAEALAGVDPGHSARYRDNVERLRAALASRKVQWATSAAPLRGLEIVVFHDTWPYFCRAFGMTTAGFVEPLPGIEPSPSHTASIIEIMKARSIRIVGVEPYFSKRTPETIARATGAAVVVMPPSVGGAEGADDYLSLFDTLIASLTAASATPR